MFKVQNSKKIAVIGAGFTGLSLAYFLSKDGHQVEVFEKSSHLGGLASGIKIGKYYIDKFYHHIFSNDKDVIGLAKELGFNNWIKKSENTTSTFYNNKLYSFSSPKDLLVFDAIPFTDRIRTGLVSALLKLKSNEKGLENKIAASWIKSFMGDPSWKVIWKPLLLKKFTKIHFHKISMSWFWSRIYKRSFKLLYPEGGFESLAILLAQNINKYGGKIKLNHAISNINQIASKYDKIVFTGSSSSLAKIDSNLPNTYKQKCKQKKGLSAMALIIEYNGDILPKHYWININSDLPKNLVCVVNHSTFVSKSNSNNKQIIYMAGYFDPQDAFFKTNKKIVVEKWLPFLKKLDSSFKLNKVAQTHLFKADNAQPIMGLAYKKQILPFKTPIKDLYLVNIDQIYPYDRGVNFAVLWAKKALSAILKN